MSFYKKELQLDLDVNAGGELQARKSLDRLVGRLQDVDETLVGAVLELLAAVFVLVYRAQVMTSLSVGRGTGPDTRAPVRFAVSTIFSAALSMRDAS